MVAVKDKNRPISHSCEPRVAINRKRSGEYDLGTNPEGRRNGTNTVMFNVRPTMQRMRTREEEDYHDHSPIIENRRIKCDDDKGWNLMKQILGQVPAVALVCIFHLMIGIPFGVSYFPIGWRTNDSTHANHDSTVSDGVNGPFPIAGKEALGIRMFLFATIIGQIAFTFSSKFTNAVGLQMVENVPFCQSLAVIVISDQGYGIESLSTLFFLFGFASVFVGFVFYILGKFKLGKVVYFFPSHVLLGLIGGIGIFIAKTGLEVTLDAALKFEMNSINTLMHHFDLIGVVFIFEIVLRLLQWVTSGRYKLLSPIYFCMITPIFYVCLWCLQVNIDDAKSHGYFFPSLDENCNAVMGNCPPPKSFLESSFNADAFMMWRVIDISSIHWQSIIRSIPTLISLALFSLIHVPINIPAFAVSTNVEADMNAELIAHGYSNAISGLFGGLQNYMAYTQSVIYARSNGDGRGSSIAIVVITSILFFIGPTIASYIPKCMAGTLLLHCGIDLFLEGMYDTIGKFDVLEYSGICIIAFVMTFYGMEGAMIAGIISALSTYAIQNITYLNPIRGYMTAATLRSSSMDRCPEAVNILNDNRTGRNRILVIQLQGHLFFGNIAQFNDGINEILNQKKKNKDAPLIVMMDFTLVLGIDSSAAQAIIKLKDAMHKIHRIKVCIFVTGTKDGFPCEFKLTKELTYNHIEDLSKDDENGTFHLSTITESNSEIWNEETYLLETGSDNGVQSKFHSSGRSLTSLEMTKHAKNFVTDKLDSALEFAEDILIAFENELYLINDNFGLTDPTPLNSSNSTACLAEERKTCLRYLNNLSPGQEMEDIEELFSLFQREEYIQDDIIWKQGSPGDCMKLLVQGSLLSILENEAGTCEAIKSGNTIGELGLVNRMDRMSTVKCVSTNAILYSLSRESWDILTKSNPKVARIVDLLLIRYLAHRVQHVSNRIFETRCLPI